MKAKNETRHQNVGRAARMGSAKPERKQHKPKANQGTGIEAVFGIHAVTSLISRQPEQIIALHLLSGREDEKLSMIVSSAQQLGIQTQSHDRESLDQLVGEVVHQGVVAICKPLKTYSEAWLDQLLDKTEQPLLLVLDGVTDPHNLGACLRTADAAGVHAVIVPKDRAAPLNATVRKVACGAAEAMPVVSVTNLSRTLNDLKKAGVWVVGTAGEAEQSIYQSDVKGSIALVMGAEGKGMRRLTREHCDLLINLPMSGEVSSLNVSVATGVCLYEIVRQRTFVK